MFLFVAQMAAASVGSRIMFLFTGRYLAKFLNVRETVPNGYRLLGQIEEAVGNKENAVEAYKRYSTYRF